MLSKLLVVSGKSRLQQCENGNLIILALPAHINVCLTHFLGSDLLASKEADGLTTSPVFESALPSFFFVW